MLLSPGISTRKLINRAELYSPLDKKRCLRYGDIYLEEKKQWIFLPNGVSHLSAKEIQILKYLMKRNGSLVTKEELFTKIWKTSYVGDANTLYTHINYLRDAIKEDPSSLRYLHTITGKRYLINGMQVGLVAARQPVESVLPELIAKPA